MTTARFDPVVHAPNRLQICAMLAEVDDVDFSVLRESLGVSDSVLSKHLRVLEEAGYLELKKAAVTSRVRTRVAMTQQGADAFVAHVAELQRLVPGMGAPSPAPAAPSSPPSAEQAPATRAKRSTPRRTSDVAQLTELPSSA